MNAMTLLLVLVAAMTVAGQPTPAPDTPSPIQIRNLTPANMAVNSVFVAAYAVVLVLSIGRARVLRDSQDPHNRRSYRFFLSVITHCPIRISVVLLQTFSNEFSNSAAYATNIGETIGTALPGISFQTAMYVYLRVWQRQCEHLDASRPAPSVKTTYVVAWYLTWLLLMGLDVFFDRTNVNHEALCVMLFTIFNYVFIACGFAYLGERIHTSVVSMYGSDSAATYEKHVARVKWFFGLACLTHGICGILQVWITSSPVFAWLYFGPVYYCIVELMPLFASILSIYWIQRTVSILSN